MNDGPRPVLVVDDDPDILEMLQLFLELEGYEVLTAHDGAEALDVLRRASTLPGLILLDLMMPGVDGGAFRATQIGDPRLANVPVVVMSGAGRLDERVGEMGIAEYLEKPVAAERLLAVVRHHLDPSA